MVTALTCGFLHHLVPAEDVNFERLHIFLFNLCTGGTLIVYFTEGKKELSLQAKMFLALSLCFAFSSFLEFYSATLVIPLLLAYIIERVRIHHFGSVFPHDIFSTRENNARKFHQASLLCLSIGLCLSSPVILNEVYLKWFDIPKLRLDTFFLGFSFPVSLISMSVIFSLMRKDNTNTFVVLKNLAFWTINLGVIIFFLFILANWFIPQVVISTILFIAVSIVLWLYSREGVNLQQKAFLTSGIFFLVITSITGIVYILLAFSPDYDPQKTAPLLRLHSFTALYGWNLSGLVVVSRHNDFPIQLHSTGLIATHWLTVMLLFPLGYFYPAFSVIAVLTYAFLVYSLIFKSGRVDEKLVELEDDLLEKA